MVVNCINNTLYDKLPNLILGFHGCNRLTYDNVIVKRQHLRPSDNDYDWLGNGIYFWENSYERALEWAENKYGEDACVVGAVISLGRCLNLTDYKSSKILKASFEVLSSIYKLRETPMPENKKGRSDRDILLRNRDCAVIQMIHTLAEKSNDYWKSFDSVRGVFVEGKPVYEGAAISEKTHIQLCIVNPNCIKGYFSPIEPDDNFAIP